MKKVISIVTATRAEYGLLKPLIRNLMDDEEFDVKIVATGMHLAHEFGLTYREIEADGFDIDEKIEILLSSDSSTSIAKTMGLSMISFGDYFERLNPDLLVVLGDRYEILSIASVALIKAIPILHIHGGEITVGAVDDSIRHAITKMSHLHCTSTEEYKKRVIQMGEQPHFVHNVGALGVENSINQQLLNKSEILDELNIDSQMPYILVGFHPETLKEGTLDDFSQLLEALASFKDYYIIFTLANADHKGREINEMIHRFSAENSNTRVFSSLGSKRYLSAIKYCDMVIGNSSSGIIEAPSFHVPTINIGNRQQGRIQAESVINCRASKEEIRNAILKARSETFLNQISLCSNPYGNGNTSVKITKIIKDFLNCNIKKSTKKFYDLE